LFEINLSAVLALYAAAIAVFAVARGRRQRGPHLRDLLRGCTALVLVGALPGLATITTPFRLPDVTLGVVQLALVVAAAALIEFLVPQPSIIPRLLIEVGGWVAALALGRRDYVTAETRIEQQIADELDERGLRARDVWVEYGAGRRGLGVRTISVRLADRSQVPAVRELLARLFPDVPFIKLSL
jgi:hypothetical protein